MRVVFFGSGEFGVPTLRALVEGGTHQVLAVVTQPDRPVGRGGKLTATPIGQFAAASMPGVEVFKPDKVNEAGLVEKLRGCGADAFVVIAFGQKLGRKLLDGVFAINLHGSLLPRWRGASPVNAAVLAGDAQSGNSVITLADTMDAGLILGQSRRPVPPSMTAGELHDALSGDGPGLVLRVLEEKATGTLRPLEQDQANVTLAGKLSKADGWIDFAAGAEACRRRVHGLNPWPGVTGSLRGEPLKILRVEVGGEESKEPAGMLVDAARGVVSCGSGAVLRLLEVQPAGKKAMAWADFARGKRVENGEVVSGRWTAEASA